MLPTGMPSRALMSAYGRGGSAMSRANSRWPFGGQLGERLAQRGVALGGQQFLRPPGPLVREVSTSSA